MKKKSGLFGIILLIILVVSLRLYKKYNREQARKEQQKQNTEFYLKSKKLEQERIFKQQEVANQNRLDSINAIRKAAMDEKVNKLKETQKRIQKEMDAKKE